VQELLDLLLPARCALCSRLGSPVCSDCNQKLIFRSHCFSRGAYSGFAASDYGDLEKSLIHQFKESGKTSLARYLALPMIDDLVKLAEMAEPAEMAEHSEPSARPCMVPMPSSRQNYAKRGFNPAMILARRLNALAGRPAEVRSALKLARRVEDQSALDSDARAINLQGSMTCSKSMFGRAVILFDDVVTTGATLQEAARAATEAGATAVRFLVFSETILKTRPKT